MSKETTAQKIARLERQNMELNAQLASALHFAKVGILNANRAKTTGSAIIVRMHYLGGKEVCPPFALRDGLSDELIAALKSDLNYSFDIATIYKP